MEPTSKAQRCKKYRDKTKENYKKNDALRKKRCRLMMKLNDSEKNKEKKEKDKLRKRAERKRKKLELEALQAPSTSPQTTIARVSKESSAFKYRSTKQRYVKKVEKYLPKSPGKRREVLHEITNKFCVPFDFKAKRGKKKDELSDEELKWLKDFLDRPDISYMNPGRKDHVYVGKKDGVKVYEQKRYLLWKIQDLYEIANGGSVIEEAGGDSFSNAFGRPLKFALLYDVLKLHKEYVFNRDIPQWSCLCELCENVTLLATGVNKVLKDKLPTSPHDIVEKFSCSSTRHCMYDACCEICSSIDVNIPDNMEK